MRLQAGGNKRLMADSSLLTQHALLGTHPYHIAGIYSADWAKNKSLPSLIYVIYLMELKFDLIIAEKYTSSSQRVRVLSESWVEKNIYCPCCGNEQLNSFQNNAPVADFFCSNCQAEYELKSKKDAFTQKIVDGAYGTMIKRINSDNNPHFFFLNYSNNSLAVNNFLVIPKHFFLNDIIEKRKPLGINARRAGWIGCNILLQNIPESGKIFFVKNGVIENPENVLNNWSRTSFLANQKRESRGWTIEIMKIIDKLKCNDFSLQDIYRFEWVLKEKFPNNNFVKDKIRQQLQILRDKGLIVFKGRGVYSKV